MQKSANGYAERYDVKFGIPNVKPKPGETFDRNNDLTLSECGAIVYHRDGLKHAEQFSAQPVMRLLNMIAAI